MFDIWVSHYTEKLSGVGIARWDIIALRFGLGLVLLYAALSIFSDAQAWVGFVPDWVTLFSTKENFLVVHAVFELTLGLALIMGWFLPMTSLVAFFDFASILIFYGIDIITFRDFGLTLAAFALFFRSITNRRM